MDLPSLYNLEREGISETIRGYAVEHYIKSYSKQLLDLNINTDKEQIEVIVKRLIEWYKKNISSIDQSKFVSNKEEHQKSYRLLIELNQRIESEINY